MTELLLHGSTRAQEAALLALRGHGPDVRDTVIGWTPGQARPGDGPAPGAHGPGRDGAGRLDAGRDGILGFLCDVLERRERRVEDQTLGALVVLGAPEAGGVIRRCLRSDDLETRAQAIEALDSTGDRRLSGALVRLLEDDGHGLRDRDAVVNGLLDDDDAWIARLMRATIAGETDMPQTSRTLGDLETMLLLRRVPIFEGLEPEDLQRIALAAVGARLPGRRGDRPRGRPR